MHAGARGGGKNYSHWLCVRSWLSLFERSRVSGRNLASKDNCSAACVPCHANSYEYGTLRSFCSSLCCMIGGHVFFSAPEQSKWEFFFHVCAAWWFPQLEISGNSLASTVLLDQRTCRHLGTQRCQTTWTWGCSMIDTLGCCSQYSQYRTVHHRQSVNT